jgi:SAM-dependent methyltransferase
VLEQCPQNFAQIHRSETRCRSCGGSDLTKVLDLGEMPLADRLISAAGLKEPEPRFPLRVAFCGRCALVQIIDSINAHVLFDQEYPYYSSFSPALLAHSKANVGALIDSRRLSPSSLVIELASNDGYLLKNYVEAGIPVLGIDPATGPAEAAVAIGVPTLKTFFTLELARQLVRERNRADVIHANNVLAHVPDLNSFVQGIRETLKDDGVAVIEVPYLKCLIDHLEFDTIYHEHMCYFSVCALDNLFRRNGLYLNDIQHLSIHGGSLRLFVERVERVKASVHDQLAIERAEGLDRIDYFRSFAKQVAAVRTDLLELLHGLKAQGARVAAYGAAAKGATLINYVGLGTDVIDFVVDRNVHKQGRYMPGQKIQILPTEALLERKPDYVLVLAWNFIDEIAAQQRAYLDRGGRFVIPVPNPRIYGEESHKGMASA